MTSRKADLSGSRVGPSAKAPTVALLVAVRNEADHIDAVLSGLAGQTYPHDRLVIAVIDGESTDDTRERVARWSERDGRIMLLGNPERVMAAGLNIGIRSTRSDIVGVIGGHSSVAEDYVERAVAALTRTGAWAVGGRVIRVGTTPVQRTIARAASSPIGVGDSSYYSTEPGWAETAYPGMWPRWVFEQIGLFDPAVVSNEDNELSTRILGAGGRIWYEPSIEVRHVPRGSLRGAFHQYRQYAAGKREVYRKHRGALRWRHFVPPLWVAWLLARMEAAIAEGDCEALGIQLDFIGRDGVDPDTRVQVIAAVLHRSDEIGCDIVAP